MLSLSQTTNFRPSKLKEFAAHNFKFDRNGRKLSKLVQNTVGKFLLFAQSFEKTFTADTQKPGLV